MIKLIAVIQMEMNKRDGNGGGSSQVEGVSDAAEISNVIIAGLEKQEI